VQLTKQNGNTTNSNSRLSPMSSHTSGYGNGNSYLAISTMGRYSMPHSRRHKAMPLDPRSMDLSNKVTMHDFHIKLQYDTWTIPPLRHNNVFIMLEAIKDIGLTISQMEQINAC